jgi:hypothetical protein
LQHYSYSCNAWIVCAWRLPYLWLFLLKFRRNSAHFGVNHGTRCLSHLLGLVNLR